MPGGEPVPSPGMDAELQQTLRHRLRPMPGRDPRQRDRISTPLELLYDLTYVVAFGVAADQLASGIEHGDIAPAIGAYAFALFSVTWAWTNFTWFTSAYGNDDALFRVATIVQMVGVVILVFGLPASSQSTIDGGGPNNALLVVGYTVMRLPQLILWLRAARTDAEHRRDALAYAIVIGLAQAGWALTVAIPLPTPVLVAVLCALVLAELGAPVVIEKRLGSLPWNPQHVAERFGLLTLITLGEVVAATTAAVGALVDEHGWSLPAVVVVSAGILMTASLWWAYFLIPAQPVLRRFPERTMSWRYAHLPMFAGIAAVGAGLRVTAAAVGSPAVPLSVVVLSLAVPVIVVLILVFATWSVLLRAYDLSHVPLFLCAIAPIVAAAAIAVVHGPAPFDASDPADLTLLVIAVGLVALGCVVEVVGHELVGYTHTRRSLAR